MKILNKVTPEKIGVNVAFKNMKNDHTLEIKDIVNVNENYPYVTRILLSLFNEGRLSNIEDIKVEKNYGYITQIKYKDGNYRITYGSDVGINSGSSEELAKDKGYTKFILKDIGINVPKGEEFLLPWWVDTIRESQAKRGNNNIKTSDKAVDYVYKELGFPVYVKSVNGSKGLDVYKVQDENELNEIFSIYNEKKVKVAIIEEVIAMPDYRIVILDGELISAYKRIPLTVIGNGESNIKQLLENLQIQYDKEGRDTRLDSNDIRIIKFLKDKGLELEYIPSLNEKLTLMAVSNLSAGGTSKDVTDSIDKKWISLSSYIAKNFNLRLCGIDISCEDITSPDSEYSILEINSSPGLDHYASSGEKQRKIVEELYIKVFNAIKH